MTDGFVFDDGGRQEAGYKGLAGDCVVRAVAIASGRPYQEIYDALSDESRTQRLTKHSKNKSSARNGVNTKRKWFKDYMESLGFEWTPTMRVGQGCKVHLRKDELPEGQLVVALSKHYAAVVDGVLYDTHDCSRDGARCVYGYWWRE